MKTGRITDYIISAFLLGLLLLFLTGCSPPLWGDLFGPPAPIPDYVAKVQVTHAPKGGRTATDTGTGVYLDDNLVLTAAHNIRDFKMGGSSLTVDGLPAAIVFRSEEHDFAFLKVPNSRKVGHFPKLSTDKRGKLLLCGYARGTEYREEPGKHVRGVWVSGKSIQGMSGGPVVNEVGDVIGTIIGYYAPDNESVISDVEIVIAKANELGLMN